MDTISRIFHFSDKFEYRDGPRKIDQVQSAAHYIGEELFDTLKSIKKDDTLDMLDGFGSVAMGGLNGIYKVFRSKYGCDHKMAESLSRHVLERICDSNLRKINANGSVEMVGNRVKKPKGWQRPKYDDLIQHAKTRA